MTATAAPFGFRPVFHSTGFDRATRRTIAGGYASAIYKGSPVILNTNGTLNVGTAAADILGIFAGVEYIDASGKPTYSPNWPAAQAIFPNSVPVAYVWEDLDTVFEVQANGSLAQAAIGDQADVVNPGNGSALTGQSTAALSSALAGAGVQAQFRIVDIAPYVDNAIGDAFTIARVKIARDQFVANKVAI